MKICWDNIKDLHLTNNGILKNKHTFFIEKGSCKRCGNPYLTNKYRQSEYCSISCLKKSMIVSEETKFKISKSISGSNHPWYGKKHSEESKRKMSEISTGKFHTKATKIKMSQGRLGEKNSFYGKEHSESAKKKIGIKNKGRHLGDKNPAYKGGGRKKGLALYDTYGKQLEWCEEVVPVVKYGINTFKVRCSLSACNKLFIPTFNQVNNRLQVLRDTIEGNNRFYCSNECKDACLVYNKSINTFISHKEYSNYELSIWSKEVLTRANYECEICGEKAEHAHHIQPKKLKPGYALDPDNGLAVCGECHYKYGHKEECSTISISKYKC